MREPRVSLHDGGRKLKDLDHVRVTRPDLAHFCSELERLRSHVIGEYKAGDISEGRAAELLEIDRFTLRLLCGVVQTEDGPVVAHDINRVVAEARLKAAQAVAAIPIKTVGDQVLEVAVALSNGSGECPKLSKIAEATGMKYATVRSCISDMRGKGKWPFPYRTERQKREAVPTAVSEAP